MSAPEAKPPLVIGCGALAVELVALTRRAGLPAVDLTCLPASLHNRPSAIPAAVRARIRKARAEGYQQLFVAYADCGTGGLLDVVLSEEGVARLEGAHCYEVYAGRAAFAQLHDEEPGTFYLTDFLVRNFDRLVLRGLGLDRHPELRPIYFGNYHRLVYLAQSDDPGLTARARRAAAELGGLAYERRFTGLGELARAMASGPTALAGLTGVLAGGHDQEARFRGENEGIGPRGAPGTALGRPAMPRSHRRPAKGAPSGDSEAPRRQVMPRRHTALRPGRGAPVAA